MAKSESFFGMRRGSTKSLTFAKFNGKQVTKDRVYQVKNPRSSEQMLQRMVIATTSAAYSALREIADHAFAGYTYGIANMARFNSINARLIRASLGQETVSFGLNPYRDRMARPGAYQISDGNLPETTNATAIDPTTHRRLTIANTNAYTGDGYVAMPWGEVMGKDTYTFARQMGIPEGGYITAVMLVGKGLSTGQAETTECAWVRLHWPKANVAYPLSETPVDNIAILTNNFLIETSTNVTYAAITEVENDGKNKGLVLSCSFKGKEIGCYAVIASQEVNKKWQRSPQRMIVVADTPLTSYDEAMQTYPTGSGYILNGDNGSITKEDLEDGWVGSIKPAGPSDVTEVHSADAIAAQPVAVAAKAAKASK